LSSRGPTDGDPAAVCIRWLYHALHGLTAARRCRSLSFGEVSRPAEGRDMASLYKRGNMWWVKWYRAGRMIRQSLKTPDKAEARRRVRALEAQAKP
jgi:hypothetical protein